MALSEYENQDYLKEHKMLKKMLDVSIAASYGSSQSMGFEPTDMHAGTSRKPQYFYYNTSELSKRTGLA